MPQNWSEGNLSAAMLIHLLFISTASLRDMPEDAFNVHGLSEEFLSDKPMTCPGLKQVFTKPSELTGVIYELISRKGKGFCKDNVKNLMLSTSEI